MKDRTKKIMSVGVFLLTALLMLFFFYRLNVSRSNLDIERTKDSFLLVSDLTADSLSYGYFQWDDMYRAIENGNKDNIDKYFDEIHELSPFVENIYLIDDTAPDWNGYYEFSGNGGKYYCDFKVFNGESSQFLQNRIVRIELNPQIILKKIHPHGGLELSEKGKPLVSGLYIHSTEDPIRFFHVISSIAVGILSSLVLYSFQSKNRHFFYETRGLEKVIFLFERTEKYSADHSRRVAEIATILGRAKGFGKRRLKELRVASLLHDIGKISIPLAILNKESELSRDEFNAVKEHVLYSVNIIENFEELSHLKRIIRSHHEKMDGSGYPDGLKGFEIPLESRILSVADIFEALIGKRPYRDPIKPGEAIEIMRKMSLDQNVITLLKENLAAVMTVIDNL